MSAAKHPIRKRILRSLQIPQNDGIGTQNNKIATDKQACTKLIADD